jgi:hypothetical protein
LDKWQILLNFTFLTNTIQFRKNVKFLFTNKQNSGASETFWIKWMYQLEDIFCPQLYPRACICFQIVNWSIMYFNISDLQHRKYND